MKVINLFGGPGIGKSTTAAGLFYYMKKLGMNVELVSEYAKDCVWEEAQFKMKDQLYLLAKQNRKLERLRDKVEYVITDSPLLLGHYYGTMYGNHPELVGPLTVDLFHTYDNINIELIRTKPYNPVGRLGSENDARNSDIGINGLIRNYCDSWTTLSDDSELIDNILEYLDIWDDENGSV